MAGDPWRAIKGSTECRPTERSKGRRVLPGGTAEGRFVLIQRRALPLAVT